jgi:dienelactone hydrolase
MTHRRKCNSLPAPAPALIALCAFWLCAASLASAQGRVVRFNTSDGWNLAGTLYEPKLAANRLAPAVVMLPEPGWVDRTIYDTYLSTGLQAKGFFALNVDLRGSGNSLGKKVLEEFSAEEMKSVQLDLKAAIGFLSSLPGVDSSRIAVVGAGSSSEYAVLEAAENSQVQAAVLISGALSDAAEGYLRLEHSVPVLGLAGKEDKASFREMAEAYALSSNRASDLLVAVGHGAVMFSHTEGLEENVIGWLERNVKALGTETEVSFRSEDGWTLHGLLRLPDGAAVGTGIGAGVGAKVPGVLLVHGAKHDQQTYHFMSREIAKRGMAALRFDWRGKGQSFLEGTPADQDEMWRDVKAALEFFASQPAVDAARLGAVAATLACVNTLQASLGDPRMKTVVLLTALEPNDEVRRLLASSDVPLFSIASLEDNNYQRGSLADSTRLVHQLSKSKHSQLLLYDDAGRGSEMLKAKPELEPMILRWLGEKLQGIPSTFAATAGTADETK